MTMSLTPLDTKALIFKQDIYDSNISSIFEVEYHGKKYALKVVGIQVLHLKSIFYAETHLTSSMIRATIPSASKPKSRPTMLSMLLAPVTVALCQSTMVPLIDSIPHITNHGLTPFKKTSSIHRSSCWNTWRMPIA